MSAKRRRRKEPLSPVKNALLVLGIIVAFGLGVVLAGGAEKFLEALYSPIPIAIFILLIIQYVLLKGRDRSRIYKLELEQLRRRRREEIEFLQRLEAELRDLESTLESETEQSEPGAQRNRAAREKLEAMRRELEGRL